MSVHSAVFTSTSITPYHRDCVNGETESVVFQFASGELPTAGSALVRVNLVFSRINVYTSKDPYLSSNYGDFYFTNPDSSYHSANLTNVSMNILSFTGGTITFTIHSSASSAEYVLNVRESCTAQMTVEWEPRSASSGTFSPTTVIHGGTQTLTINPVDPDFTHVVQWYRDETHSYSTSVAAGVTTVSFTVPDTWPVGEAYLYLTTYYNNQQVGGRQYGRWTVAVDPERTYPTAGTLSAILYQDNRIPTEWGDIYVQGYSKCILSLTGISPGNTASITDITFTVGTFSSSGLDQSIFSPALISTGTLTPSATVTNNFGNSDTVTGNSITVYPYESPKITSITSYRCLSDGTANDYGTYLAITANVTKSPVNNLNQFVTLQCKWRVRATPEQAWSSPANISNGSQTIIAANLDNPSAIYEVCVVAVDSIQHLSGTSTTKTAPILTSECVLFFKDGGLNVSIGTQGTRNNAIEINENWTIWKGTDQLDGVTPIARGGTGGSTVQAARNALGLGNTDGPVPIPNGGTGASSVQGARNALGLGNTDGPLPVANGGTGSSTATDARSALEITPANIGAAASNHSHNLNALSGAITMSQLPFKIAYGIGLTIYDNAATTIDYSSVGFQSIPCVIATYSKDGANVNGNPGSIKIYSKSTTQATAIIGGSSDPRTIDWIAIGI